MRRRPSSPSAGPRHFPISARDRSRATVEAALGAIALVALVACSGQGGPPSASAASPEVPDPGNPDALDCPDIDLRTPGGERINLNRTTEALDRQCTELLQGKGQVVRSSGDFEKALASAARKVEATYRVPYGCHAPLEPQNAYVRLEPDRNFVATSTQSPGSIPRLLLDLTGLPREKTEVDKT